MANPAEPRSEVVVARVADRSTRGQVAKWRRRRLLRRLYSLARLAFAAAVTWTLWWLWAGGFWRWDGQMTVTGNRLVGKQEIFAKLHVPQGTPLYMLDPKAIAAQVGAIPAIAHVGVRRWLFPSRLEVMVLERQALVRVEGAGGAAAAEPVSRWIDQEGVVFAAPGNHMTARFPIKVVTELQPGDRLPEAVQANLFELLSAWPHGMSGRLDLRRPTDAQATIGGWPVRLGEVQEVALKFAMFEHVLPEAGKFRDRLKYINLRFPSSPTLVLKTGAEIKASRPAIAPASPRPSASPAASPKPTPKPTEKPKPSKSP